MRIAVRGGNFTFDEVLLDEWGNVKMATGVCDCNYRRTTSTGTGVLWVWIRAYIRAGVDFTFFYEMYRTLSLLRCLSITAEPIMLLKQGVSLWPKASLDLRINIKVSTISHQRAILHHLTHLS